MLDNIPDMTQYESNEAVMLSQLDIFQQQQMQSIATTTGMGLPTHSQVNIMTGVYTLQEEPEETEENAMWMRAAELINFPNRDGVENRRNQISLHGRLTCFSEAHEKCFSKLHLADGAAHVDNMFVLVSEIKRLHSILTVSTH